MSDFQRIIDPQNFFPTFSDEEWIDWLCMGTFQEVLHVLNLCIDNGFDDKATITKRVLENWETPWLTALRHEMQHVRSAQLN